MLLDFVEEAEEARAQRVAAKYLPSEDDREVFSALKARLDGGLRGQIRPLRGEHPIKLDTQGLEPLGVREEGRVGRLEVSNPLAKTRGVRRRHLGQGLGRRRRREFL